MCSNDGDRWLLAAGLYDYESVQTLFGEVLANFDDDRGVVGLLYWEIVRNRTPNQAGNIPTSKPLSQSAPKVEQSWDTSKEQADGRNFGFNGPSHDVTD